MIKVKILPKKILMSRFWEIVFCVPLLIRRHVCLSNLKHVASCELPLTARKTVFSHLKFKVLSMILIIEDTTFTASSGDWTNSLCDHPRKAKV